MRLTPDEEWARKWHEGGLRLRRVQPLIAETALRKLMDLVDSEERLAARQADVFAPASTPPDEH
jgi:hypothetical protein